MCRDVFSARMNPGLCTCSVRALPLRRTPQTLCSSRLLSHHVPSGLPLRPALCPFISPPMALPPSTHEPQLVPQVAQSHISVLLAMLTTQSHSFCSLGLDVCMPSSDLAPSLPSPSHLSSVPGDFSQALSLSLSHEDPKGHFSSSILY